MNCCATNALKLSFFRTISGCVYTLLLGDIGVKNVIFC